jgi:1-phosphofructokinase family hexose kinase
MVYTLTLNPSLDISSRMSRLVFDDINRIEKKQLDPGGKGINVSRMLAVLGDETLPIAFYGGYAGKQSLELLSKGALSKVHPIMIQDETRTIHNFFFDDGTPPLRINEPGPSIRLSERKALEDFLKKLPSQKDDWLVCSGSLPPGVPSSFYGTLIRNMRRIHPSLSVALDSDGIFLSKGVKGRPTLLKPNLWELSRLVEKPLSSWELLVSAVKRLLTKGTESLLLSLGDKGAIGFSQSEIVWWVPPRVKVLSTVGCGDVFMAGFLHAIGKKRDFSEAVRFAVSCGTAKAAVDGTGLPTRSSIRKIRESTRPLSSSQISLKGEALLRPLRFERE